MTTGRINQVTIFDGRGAPRGTASPTRQRRAGVLVRWEGETARESAHPAGASPQGSHP